MDNGEYDILLAESVLMMARAATGGGAVNAGHRLAVFPKIVDELDKAVSEVRRAKVRYNASLVEAMEAVRVIVRKEIDDALAKHSKILVAALGVRGAMEMRRKDDAYLWSPTVSEQDFSEAIDRLFMVLLEAE